MSASDISVVSTVSILLGVAMLGILGIHGGTSHLLHWGGCAPRHVNIPVGGASSKVMIGNRREGETVIVIITAGHSGCKRGTRVAAVRTRNTNVVVSSTGGIPVDRLHTGIKVGRGTEFPFTNDGPDDSGAHNAGANDNENGQGGFTTCAAISGSAIDNGSGAGRSSNRATSSSLDDGGGRRGSAGGFGGCTDGRGGARG